MGQPPSISLARHLVSQQKKPAEERARVPACYCISERHWVRPLAFGGTMQSLVQDLRYGLRMLLNKPGFAAVAVITLALGIGANTAIFSVVNAVLLRPLPYREPGKLVRVYTEFPTMNLRKFWMSAPEFLDIQREAGAWESIGAWTTSGRNIATTNDEPIRVNAALITRGLIEALGVQPARGRNFTPQEDINGGPRTALISDGLWRRA